MSRKSNSIRSEIRPQSGPQEAFLSCKASIAIYGGAAGSGKTHALLLEPLFHVSNPAFRAVTFRRTVPMIKTPGGLWDASQGIYGLFNAQRNETSLEWRFDSGSVLKFAGMEMEGDRYDWQGSQLSLIQWDELTHFTEQQFFYMLSRCRSLAGIPGYVRGTCNPDSESWVRVLLDWWIDPDSGYAIPERSGVFRWFVRDGDQMIWGSSREELVAKFGPESEPKSLTFIPANIRDNRILLEKDPGYLSNLKALPLVEREQLLMGNWNIRPSAGNVFRREWFEIVDFGPPELTTVDRVRFWDRAASPVSPSNPDPDWTVGVLMSKDVNGVYYVEQVERLRESAFQVEQAMARCGNRDGMQTTIGFAQDPGSAGKGESEATVRFLDGFDVRCTGTLTGDKATRAKPFSAQAESGNVKIVRGHWNQDFLKELEGFPAAKHDDQVDAATGAYEMLRQRNGGGSYAPVPRMRSDPWERPTSRQWRDHQNGKLLIG